jgi:malate synthase
MDRLAAHGAIARSRVKTRRLNPKGADMRISDRLSVEDVLHAFVETELLPETGVAPAAFWAGLEAILADFTPKNAALLARRDDLQARIDAWWLANPGKVADVGAQQAFLKDIGYLAARPALFTITTENVDPEIATLAGPQLVVPASNARYALNAANARWGSLYDALYGTDAIDPPTGRPGYDAERGAKVIAYGRAFLDRIFPLAKGSHADATSYGVRDDGLTVALADGSSTGLADPAAFAGWRQAPNAILLKHNGLHAEIVIDRESAIGATDGAGVADIVLESALTAIQDCEDSVAAVDADEKVALWRNWLGLMKGDLAANFDKGGKTATRRLAEDRQYQGLDGEFTLPGRSLMLVRNVGHHMTSDAATFDGEPSTRRCSTP